MSEEAYQCVHPMNMSAVCGDVIEKGNVSMQFIEHAI